MKKLTDDEKVFMRRLKKAMNKKNMSAFQFAMTAGVRENNVYKWLAGRVPRSRLLKMAARALDVPAGWLLGDGLEDDLGDD